MCNLTNSRWTLNAMQMAPSGVCKKKRRRRMKSKSERVLTTTDLHNLRVDVREGKQVRDEERLLRVLEDVQGEDKSSSVMLTVDNSGQLEMICIQTTAMKKSMVVLIVDSTNRCNNRRMPLSSIMVMDGNSKGQIAHALLWNERQTLWSFLNTFTTENQTVSQSKIFLVDKDVNEMAVLKSLWPDANIFLSYIYGMSSVLLR